MANLYIIDEVLCGDQFWIELTKLCVRYSSNTFKKTSRILSAIKDRVLDLFEV